MRSKRQTILVFLLVCVLALAGAGIYFFPQLQQRWSEPLGPGLGLPTHTLPAVIPDTPQTEAPVTELAITSAVQPTITPSLTQTPAALCGGPPVMYILGIGADSGESYNYGLADAIRVARIDFVIPKVTMLTVPRDLWVEIPEINTKYDITHGKLNQAYFYGGPGMGYYDGPGGAPGLLARTLDLNFGLRADHYGAVNMNTFVKIVDALGGIDVYLPTSVDGTSEDPATIDLGFFTAGQHHFSGEEALRFARIRKKYNDFTRQDHQTMVMCALQSKLKEPSVFGKIHKLVAAFQDSIQTDLSPQQITQLACLLPQLKRENIIFAGFPEDIMEPGRVYNPQQKKTTFIMETDFEVLRDYVDQFIAGTWPDQPEEPSCP